MNVANPTVNRAIYACLAVLNLVIGATILEIGKGNVPFPEGMAWTVPILLAGLNGVTLFLPRVGSEMIAGRVNKLRDRGVSRERIRVIDAADPTVRA